MYLGFPVFKNVLLVLAYVNSIWVSLWHLHVYHILVMFLLHYLYCPSLGPTDSSFIGGLVTASKVWFGFWIWVFGLVWFWNYCFVCFWLLTVAYRSIKWGVISRWINTLPMVTPLKKTPGTPQQWLTAHSASGRRRDSWVPPHCTRGCCHPPALCSFQLLLTVFCYPWRGWQRRSTFVLSSQQSQTLSTLTS